jgi:hypothetical protein
MQYFTPELFGRLQDLKDHDALQAWDRAAESYASALRKVLPSFPPSVRKLAGKYILHDAEVLFITRSRDNLSITLQPELEGGHLLILSYTLVGEPQFNPAAIPEKYRTEYAAWLYDELSRGKPVPRRPPRRKAGAAARNGRSPVYCHDILLSNGWELFLRFRQVKITRPQRLLPPPESFEDDPAGSLSRSA